MGMIDDEFVLYSDNKEHAQGGCLCSQKIRIMSKYKKVTIEDINEILALHHGGHKRHKGCSCETGSVVVFLY